MTSVLDTVKNDNLKILKILVAVPQTVSKRDLNFGLLHAAIHGYAECLQCLLVADADFSAENASGNTPLYLAVLNNNPACVEALLKAGSNANIKGSGKNTSIHIAAKMGYEKCLQHLMSHGANINATDSSGSTALMLAVKNKQYLVMRLLLAANCNINATDNEGRTALHYASQTATGIEQLLAAGADPNICDKDNNTPLLLAAAEGFDKVVKLLARANCDVNIANSSVKRTPLHILSLKGHADCIEDLVFAGADINLYDDQFHTPLWYAVYNGRFEVIKLLLKANSQVDTFQCSKEIPPAACPTLLALSKKMTNVAKLFILTGFDKAHLKVCLRDPEAASLFQNEDLAHWLDHAHDVMTLKQTCRIWIRHHLGRNFFHDLNYLPLPQGLKDFLFLKELDDDHQ